MRQDEMKTGRIGIGPSGKLPFSSMVTEVRAGLEGLKQWHWLEGLGGLVGHAYTGMNSDRDQDI